MSSTSKSAVAVTPKLGAQKNITTTTTVVHLVPSINPLKLNKNTQLDKSKMLELRKQRNQSIAAAGGMANLSFFSGKMMEAVKKTGDTSDKKTSLGQGQKTTSDNPEAFRSFVNNKMLEAVNLTKQNSGIGSKGRTRGPGRPKKAMESQMLDSEESQRSLVRDPNDYVTPVFSLDSSDILDMVLSEVSPGKNSDEIEEKKVKPNKPEPRPQMSSKPTQAPQSTHSSTCKKPFQLRQQLRLKPKKKIEPPKIKPPRLVGEVTDIRQQLLSKFSQVTSTSPEVVSRIVSKPLVKSVPTPNKHKKSTKPDPVNSSSRSSLSIGNVTPVSIRSTPRCSLAKKPSKQNISLADPSRKMAGTVQFMLSSAITKVLQTPPSSKRKVSSALSQSSSASRPGGGESSNSIPAGYGRPTRPPGSRRVCNRKKFKPNAGSGSSSEEDLIDSSVRPWESRDEEDDEQFEEGPYEVDDVKIEVVNDEDEEEEMISHDPLDMPYDNLEEDTNDEYNTSVFEGFQYEEETEENHCDYEGDGQAAVMDVKPEVSSQTALIKTEPIDIGPQIVKTEPQENSTAEYII